MFLNLKNKKIIETIANNQQKPLNNPKSYREETQVRQSKQKQPKSFRPPMHQNSKKQTGSTAMSTIHQPNTTFTQNSAHNQRQPQNQIIKNTVNELSKSQQKLDSQRMQRITSAYRKLKKYDTLDASSFIQENKKSQQKIIKNIIIPNKVNGKKQMVSTFMNAYATASLKGGYQQSPFSEKIQINMVLNQLNIIFDLFELDHDNPTLKYRSQSQRHLKASNSVEKKRQLKQQKKASNDILIRDNSFVNIPQSSEDFLNKFMTKTQFVREQIDKLSIENYGSLLIQFIKKLVNQFQDHLMKACEIFANENLQNLQNYQKILDKYRQKQKYWQIHTKELAYALQNQMEKTKNLQTSLIEHQNKNLYSTAFLNQISHHFNVDTHIQQKIYQQALKNGFIHEDSFIQNIKQQSHQYQQESKKIETNLVDIRDSFQDYSFSQAVKFSKSK